MAYAVHIGLSFASHADVQHAASRLSRTFQTAIWQPEHRLTLYGQAKLRGRFDKRLINLNQQRGKLENRLHELDRIVLSKAEINTITIDAMKFISSLEFVLHQGLAQEKLVALRQRIERIYVNKPDREIKLVIRTVPAGNLLETGEFRVNV